MLDFCAGSTYDIIQRLKAPLEEHEIVAIASQTLQGLTYVHEKCIAHRDLKAGNILLSDDGVAKIGDCQSLPIMHVQHEDSWRSLLVHALLDTYTHERERLTHPITCGLPHTYVHTHRHT